MSTITRLTMLGMIIITGVTCHVASADDGHLSGVQGGPTLPEVWRADVPISLTVSPDYVAEGNDSPCVFVLGDLGLSRLDAATGSQDWSIKSGMNLGTDNLQMLRTRPQLITVGWYRDELNYPRAGSYYVRGII